jgi:4-hydroxybenzoyl-CoA reductase subunit beta
MMRLPAFEHRAPATVREAAAILSGEGPRAMLLAGGTDLLPNMKRRQQVPQVVVSLARVGELRARRREDDWLTLGATTTLGTLAADVALAREAPALHRAAAQVATPHLRNMATLGGNLLLDTRCTYYDQTEEWRRAIGYCMKKDGDTCWVAPSSSRCLAVSSTDTAPALIALGAEVTLVSSSGDRRVRLRDLYANDGIDYTSRRPDEVLTEIHVPMRAAARSTYWKLRRRGSIDFPVLGVAAWVDTSARGAVVDARIVLGAVASRPLIVPEAAEALRGRELTDEAIETAAALASKPAKPMDNTDFELHWRKRVVATFVAGALRQLRGDDPRTMPPLSRRAALAVAPVP